MNRHRLGYVFAFLGCCAIFSRPLAATVAGLASGADAIIVARPTVSATGTAPGHSVTLLTVRSLHGSLASGAVVMADTGRVESPTSPDGCGIWFLRQANGKMTVVPVSTGPEWQALRLSLSSCKGVTTYSYGVGASGTDKVLMELAESFEASNGKIPNTVNLFAALKGARSPAEPRVIQRFAKSANGDLRAVSLALRIRNGDETALREAEIELAKPRSTQATLVFVTSISDFDQPNGVETLGRLATSPQTELPVQRAAAGALRKIHNAAAMGPLYRLLDHPDRAIRESAVSGFTLNRLGVPSGLSSANLDRALQAAASPSGKFATAKEREGLHMGPFSSAAEEAAIIGFYKKWWPLQLGR